MSSTYTPSSAVVTKAVITTFSGQTKPIDALIGAFEITQSLDKPGYTGFLKIVDSVGLLEKFKLRGEEKLDLEILSRDLNTKISLQTHVYKIDNVKTGGVNDRLFYDVYFMSRVNFEAMKKRIIMPFQNVTAAGVVEQLFRKYFSELEPLTSVASLPYNAKAFNLSDDTNKKFYLQPTSGELKVIIPNYTPTEAMNFMSMKSYSLDSSSSSFRFFETYDSFYYVTEEFLIKKANDNPSEIIELVYAPVGTLDPRDAALQVRLIESFTNDVRINSISDILSGGYSNKAVEIDLIRRNMEERNFYYRDNVKYLGMSGQKASISDDVHSEEFIEKTFNNNNAKRFIIIRDFGRVGDNPSNIRADQFYTEIASNKMFHEHHLNATSVNVFLKGRLDIQAGKVIKINAPEFNIKDKKEENQQLSGNYLVHSVVHNLDGNTLKTKLRLVKYNWSK